MQALYLQACKLATYVYNSTPHLSAYEIMSETKVSRFFLKADEIQRLNLMNGASGAPAHAWPWVNFLAHKEVNNCGVLTV